MSGHPESITTSLWSHPYQADRSFRFVTVERGPELMMWSAGFEPLHHRWLTVYVTTDYVSSH